MIEEKSTSTEAEKMSNTTEKSVQAAIPRLDRYYDNWSMMMKNFLRSKELWTLVEDGIPTTPRGTTMSEAQ